MASLFKVTFAGAIVALAFAVTYTSSADVFSDFDRRTIATLGGTVTAALLLVALGMRAIVLPVAAALAGLVARIAAVALALIALAGVTFAGVLAVTYSSPAEAFSVFHIRTVAAAFGATANAALLSGALLLLLPASRLDTDTQLDVLLTLTTLAGVTTAYLVHTDLWTSSPAVVIALYGAAGFALFVAFRFIDDRPQAGAALPAAALVGLAAVIVGHAEPRAEPVSGDVSNIRDDVSLSKTPNLYFISFDALVPRALLKKYLDVETTGFHALFDARFRRFPNLFANGGDTKQTLYTLLALDPRVHETQAAVLGDTRTFSGQHPSPLLGILRRSGYETSTLFYNHYFGNHKGPWVDNYAYFEDRTLCSMLDAPIRPWAFWGYCRWFDHESPTYLVERITSVNVDGGPQFMMAHILVPGHTHVLTYRHGDAEGLAAWREQYLRNIEEAAHYLDLIVRHVEADPDAILLVYGDHGMIVSRGMEYDDDPEFFTQDVYGVLGGVFPPDACAPWFDAAAAPGWMTLLDAVHAVLFCLSDGEGALVEPELARQWYARFGDFLYE